MSPLVFRVPFVVLASVGWYKPVTIPSDEKPAADAGIKVAR